MEIHFTLKQTYGKVRVVPLCINAITFADIAGTSTLTLRAMRNVEALGYKLMCTPMYAGGTAPMTPDQLKEVGVE